MIDSSYELLEGPVTPQAPQIEEPEVSGLDAGLDFMMPVPELNSQPEANSQVEAGHSILDGQLADALGGELTLEPESQAGDQATSQHNRVKAQPASTSKTLSEPDLLDEEITPPPGHDENTESLDLKPTPLPAVKDIPAPSIVLKARPVERHLLNDPRNQNEDQRQQHTSVADASHLVPPRLRPTDKVQFENLPQIDAAQPDQTQELPEAEADNQPSENEEPLSLGDTPSKEPLTATSYESPLQDTILRARPAIDASANPIHQPRAWFSEQPPHRTAILRLHAITPPDQTASQPSIASFDMDAPVIVQSIHPDVVPPKFDPASENLKRAVPPMLKAKTQIKRIER